jgi:Fe-S cluster biogenesis protein NfuA
MNNDIVKKIEHALDDIRPYLRSDGGDISFLSIDENYEVRVKLMGACENCPMSFQTMKSGVEKAIQKAVPEVKKVITVDESLQDVL